MKLEAENSFAGFLGVLKKVLLYVLSLNALGINLPTNIHQNRLH